MPQTPLEAAIQNPYKALSLVLGDTLHPGGTDATNDLLDRAQVSTGTRLLDLGCGAGAALEQANTRGADPIGLDTDPSTAAASVRANLEQLPFADASVDVVLSECALCLADNLEAALREARRVIRPQGRFAFSDVTVERSIPNLPEPVKHALCLTGNRSPQRLIGKVEHAGFRVVDQEDHRDDLLRIRDRIHDRIDVEGLLSAIGPAGQNLLAGVRETERALETGDLGYISLVAEPL